MKVHRLRSLHEAIYFSSVLKRGMKLPLPISRRKRTVSPMALAFHMLNGRSTIIECSKFYFIVSFPANLRQVKHQDSGAVARQEFIYIFFIAKDFLHSVAN